jgi:hypothetical protein
MFSTELSSEFMRECRAGRDYRPSRDAGGLHISRRNWFNVTCRLRHPGPTGWPQRYRRAARGAYRCSSPSVGDGPGIRMVSRAGFAVAANSTCLYFSLDFASSHLSIIRRLNFCILARFENLVG